MLNSPFVLVLFVCPAVVAAVSIAGNLLIRRWFVVPLVTLSTFTVLTLTVFNESFAIWVVVYTVLSVVVTLFVRAVRSGTATH